MDNNIFIDTYFFYCNERCTFEGIIEELEKETYFPIEIEDLKNFSNYPINRAAFSLIALSASAGDNILRTVENLVFEKGQIKSPYIIIADISLKGKLNKYFSENEPNLLYQTVSMTPLKEIIAARKKELQPFQCNLSIPHFSVSPYSVGISKYSSDGNSIYEDHCIAEIFNAFKKNNALNNHSFAEIIRNLYLRQQQLINKIRINSRTYLLHILPLPSNNIINFSLMKY